MKGISSHILRSARPLRRTFTPLTRLFCSTEEPLSAPIVAPHAMAPKIVLKTPKGTRDCERPDPRPLPIATRVPVPVVSGECGEADLADLA